MHNYDIVSCASQPFKFKVTFKAGYIAINVNCPSGSDELIRVSPRKNITAESCTVGTIHDLR